MEIEQLTVTYTMSGFPIDLDDQILVCNFETLEKFKTFSDLLIDCVECREVFFTIDGILK